MRVHPYVFALLGALGLGIVMLPWKYAIENVGIAKFSIAIGSAYLVVGFVSVFFGGTHGSDPRAFVSAGLTGLLYVGAIGVLSMAFLPRADVHVRASVIAALSTLYPLITALAEFVFEGRALSGKQLVWMCVIIAGVAGLGFSRGD